MLQTVVVISCIDIPSGLFRIAMCCRNKLLLILAGIVLLFALNGCFLFRKGCDCPAYSHTMPAAEADTTAGVDNTGMVIAGPEPEKLLFPDAATSK